MAIRSSNKINPSFSMSSMTDLIFLLLIFFVCTSTLVNPNALKLLLPQSNNQTAARPITTVSIDKNLVLHFEQTPVATISDLESKLMEKLQNEQDPTISLYVDKTVPMDEVVKVMNIAVRQRYKLILATAPEGR